LSQSPFLINAIIGYKNNSLGLIMNVTYNVFGKRLVITSQGALPDIYEQSRQSLNVVLGKQITKKFKVSFKAQNLLNPETKLSHEFKGEEFVYSTFRTGRRFSLGLSYKF
jgi:outer membrane receptor protein involved in Fe transport